MLFTPRLSTSAASQLCNRLSIAIDAGIEIRKIWSDETKRAQGMTAKSQFQRVSDAVNSGHTLTQALESTGDYFPPLMRELTAVGEESGKLDAVYKQLAEHYRLSMEMRRLFLGSIAWPMFQLFAAIFVVGLLILIIGFLQEMNPQANLDVLRFGLYGKKGLVIYCAFIACVAAAIWFVVHAISRGLAWTRFIQYFILRIPALGKTLEKLYITRFVWTLYITFDSGMEIRRAVRMSLKSAGNAFYADRIPEIEQSISQGNSLHESFVNAQCFPVEFLDALAVGEQSGRITQTLENLSRQYQDQSRLAVSVLTRIAGYAIWAIIVLILVLMIFRVAGSYLNMLNNAANGNF